MESEALVNLILAIVLVLVAPLLSALQWQKLSKRIRARNLDRAGDREMNWYAAFHTHG